MGQKPSEVEHFDTSTGTWHMSPMKEPEEIPDEAAQKLLEECDVTTFRASGPGGQHRNRRESAVRLVHRPSGIVVIAAERRSQHRNRAVALERLARKLAESRKVKKPRVATRASMAARQRRIEEKKQRSEVKKTRAPRIHEPED